MFRPHLAPKVGVFGVVLSTVTRPSSHRLAASADSLAVLAVHDGRLGGQLSGC